MPIIQVKGVANPINFPDDMDISDIREVLRNKFTQRAINGESDILSPQPDSIKSFEPSLAERMGSGIASGLTGTGLISDNYRAQQIGKNVSALAELLPGVGDATAGDDFGRNLKAGNYGSAALDAVGTMPILGDMAIFAGALAKNADIGALRKAKLLEDTGADRNKIWKETGWFNDKGDWKFEIDDSAAEYDRYFLGGKDRSGFAAAQDAKRLVTSTREEVGKLKEAGTYNVRDFWDNKPDDAYDEYQRAKKTISTFDKKVNPQRTVTDLSNVLKHDELNKNYDFSNAKATLDPSGAGGSYYKLGDQDKIEIKSAMTREYADNTGPKSTALHELQHAVQGREGFASGGSPEEFAPRKAYMKQTHKKIDTIKKENPSLARAYNDYKYKEEALNAKYGSDTDKWPNDVAEKYFSDSDEILKIDGGEELLTLSDNIYNPPASELEKMPSARYQYHNLAGEAEARLVQTRMNLTPEQRRARPPWEDLDVPEDELIYRKGGGINQSLPMDIR